MCLLRSITSEEETSMLCLKRLSPSNAFENVMFAFLITAAFSVYNVTQLTAQKLSEARTQTNTRSLKLTVLTSNRTYLFTRPDFYSNIKRKLKKKIVWKCKRQTASVEKYKPTDGHLSLLNYTASSVVLVSKRRIRFSVCCCEFWLSVSTAAQVWTYGSRQVFQSAEKIRSPAIHLHSDKLQRRM